MVENKEEKRQEKIIVENKEANRSEIMVGDKEQNTKENNFRK